VEGRQDDRNPDGGGELTDGIIAPPDTYVSQKYMPTYVMFVEDAAPVVTVDLGGERTVAAVRVHTGQEGGFRISHPAAIAVECSADGRQFTREGEVDFRQVFEPPADYVPWELDQSLRFSELPAGGRLAYAYRILLDRPVTARYVRVRCASRKGWGLLLSEVEVVDGVTVDRDVPPPVVLPALARP
jgi:hypothetical protein